MSIPILQDNLLRAEYDNLTYEGTQPFEQYVKQFEEYKDKLKIRMGNDSKRKKRFLNRILTENEEVNRIVWQIADDKSITYEATKIAMKNACNKHLSTGLFTQLLDDEFNSIPDETLPTQSKAMSQMQNADMRTMT